MSKFIFAIATLSSTIIGVGFFSLPYLTLKVGIVIMLGHLLVLGALVILIHLFFGELALKTPDFKRLPGFAKIYLGKGAEKIALISTIFGFLGAILAYLIIGGQFLTSLLSPLFGGNNLFYTIFYFSLGAIVIYFGIRIIAKIEFWSLFSFFVILILIFLRAKHLINIENFFLIENPLLKEGTGWSLKIENLFLPYGPILFSLWGASLIPEVEEMLAPTPNEDRSSSATKIDKVSPRYGVGVKETPKESKLPTGQGKDFLKIIIPISILIPMIVYLFFIFLILGITGSQTTESALTGLGNFLGDGIVALSLFFGILTTFTSFITLGLTLKKTLWYDLKISKNLAWLISCFLPLLLFLMGIKQFIPVISFIGGIMLGIDGILILLMYQKIRGKTLLVYPLILVLLGGIVYEIIYFIK